jgi:hypothetical protein
MSLCHAQAPSGVILQERSFDHVESKRLGCLTAFFDHRPENAPAQDRVLSDSLKAIPIVMNHAQQFMSHLTKEAVKQKALGFRITAIFGVAKALRDFYDVLVETSQLSETAEEKEERVSNYTASRQEALLLQQKIAAQTKAAAQEKERAATASADVPTPDQPFEAKPKASADRDSP